MKNAFKSDTYLKFIKRSSTKATLRLFAVKSMRFDKIYDSQSAWTESVYHT